MSFPNVIYRDYGYEKTTSSAKIGNLPLGTRMELPDGRIFRLAQAQTAGLAVGQMTQMPAGIEAALLTDVAVASAAAIDDATVTITAVTVAITEDLFADGYLHVNDVTGQGYVYKVKANASAAQSASCVITLEQTDPIKVALVAGSSQVGLSQHEFKLLEVTEADTTRNGPPAGIPPADVTGSYYFWVQRRGAVSALAGGTTMTVGLPCVRGAATAGEVSQAAPSGSATLEENDYIGYCLAGATTSDYALIYLTLE